MAEMIFAGLAAGRHVHGHDAGLRRDGRKECFLDTVLRTGDEGGTANCAVVVTSDEIGSPLSPTPMWWWP